MALCKCPGGVGEWLNPADCKSARFAYTGSNPVPSTTYTKHAMDAATLSGYSIVVMHQPSKLCSSVRFRVPAPTLSPLTLPMRAIAQANPSVQNETVSLSIDPKPTWERRANVVCETSKMRATELRCGFGSNADQPLGLHTRFSHPQNRKSGRANRWRS